MGSAGPEVSKVGLRSKPGSNGGSGHSSAGVLLKEELAEAPRGLREAERRRGSEEEKRPPTSIQKRRNCICDRQTLTLLHWCMGMAALLSLAAIAVAAIFHNFVGSPVFAASEEGKEVCVSP